MNVVDLVTPNLVNNYIKSPEFKAKLEQVIIFLKENNINKDDIVVKDDLFSYLNVTTDAEKELLTESLHKIFCIRNNQVFQEVDNIMTNYVAKYDKTAHLLNKFKSKNNS